MGRELRMVPPNWDHPVVVRRNGREGYQPMCRGSFEEAAADWKKDFAKWEAGEREEYIDEESRKLEFWEYSGGPPDRAYYCPWSEEDATWFQVWETVSKGTPVTPPFATREELIDYLVENGDFWDQQRRREGCTVMNCDPWSRESAERFVNGIDWAPSLVVTGGAVHSGVEAMGTMGKESVQK